MAEFRALWIERCERNLYLDSAPATGLRVRYQEGLKSDLLADVKTLVAYLRKHYYFPIRCNIMISSHITYRSEVDGHKYVGVFYDNKNACPNRMIYPQIFVCGGTDEKHCMDDVLVTLLHELSHYFQWYFMEDGRRTDRSLEMEANKWAYYVMGCYRLQHPSAEELGTEKTEDT